MYTTTLLYRSATMFRRLRPLPNFRFPFSIFPKSFACHTSAKSSAKSNHCHTSKNPLPQLLYLPHIQAPPGDTLSARAVLPELACRRPATATGTTPPQCHPEAQPRICFFFRLFLHRSSADPLGAPRLSVGFLSFPISTFTFPFSVYFFLGAFHV